MGRKTVVPPALADALTEDKPRAARVVTALANPDADSVSASPVPSVLDNAPIPAPAEIEALTQKDVETLTDEIIALEKHGVGVLLEIGKRLIAAKDKLTHGEWLPWLERVNITPRYAQRYMRLAREWTNATTLTYLGMSKALALLSLPEETRESFIAESHVVDGAEMSVNDMSVRELNEAIQARKDAEARLAETEKRLKFVEGKKLEAQGELSRANWRLEQEQQKTAAANAARAADRESAEAVIAKLTEEVNELKRKPIDVAVEAVVDPAAIEEAKREVREELNNAITHAEISRDAANKDRDYARRQLDEANTERDKLKSALNKAKGDVDSLKRKADTAIINEKVAKEEAEKARQEAIAARGDAGAVRVERDHARQELADARAELERVRADAQKAVSLADNDLALFGVLYEQVKTLVNQMSGIMMKRSDEKRENMKNALLSISTQLKEAAEL